MIKLVRDIEVGETIIKDGMVLVVIDVYEVRGGKGIITEDSRGRTYKFTKTKGSIMKVRV